MLYKIDQRRLRHKLHGAKQFRSKFWTYGYVLMSKWVYIIEMGASSVTRLGDFLPFGQLLKVSGHNYFVQIAHIAHKFINFSSEIFFGQLS